MDVSQVFSGDTLKAADLAGHEPTVVISKVEMKKYENGNKLLISFDGKKKGLVCNKTNATRIAHMFGPNTDLWVGQQITLYSEHVDFQGKLVEAIRVKVVKAPPPVRQQPVQASAHNALDDEIPFMYEWRG